jgi:hypothetical protein
MFIKDGCYAAEYCPCYEEFRSINKREDKVNDMDKIKNEVIMVEVNVKGKMYEKEVIVEVDKKDKSFCKGRVGEYKFYWKPSVYDYPMLDLTSDQYNKLYKGCKTPTERNAKLFQARKHMKVFLLEYKLLKQKNKTEKSNTVENEEPCYEPCPRCNKPYDGFKCTHCGLDMNKFYHKTEDVPKGFEPVGYSMFGDDKE